MLQRCCDWIVASSVTTIHTYLRLRRCLSPSDAWRKQRLLEKNVLIEGTAGQSRLDVLWSNPCLRHKHDTPTQDGPHCLSPSGGRSTTKGMQANNRAPCTQTTSQHRPEVLRLHPCLQHKHKAHIEDGMTLDVCRMQGATKNCGLLQKPMR